MSRLCRFLHILLPVLTIIIRLLTVAVVVCESGSGSLRGSAMESGSEAGAISSGSGGAGRVVKNGSSRLSVTGSSGVSGGGGLRSASLSDSENSVTFH